MTRSLTFKAVGRGHGKWLPATLPMAYIPQGPAGALHDFADHYLLEFPFTPGGEWCTMGAMLFRQAWMLDYGEEAAIDFITATGKSAVLPLHLRYGAERVQAVAVPDPLCTRLGVSLFWACGGGGYGYGVDDFTTWVSLGWTRARALWGSRDGAAIAMEDAFSDLLCVVSGDAVLTWDEDAKRIMVTSPTSEN